MFTDEFTRLGHPHPARAARVLAESLVAGPWHS
jgi:hypothetical protein